MFPRRPSTDPAKQAHWDSLKESREKEVIKTCWELGIYPPDSLDEGVSEFIDQRQLEADWESYKRPSLALGLIIGVVIGLSMSAQWSTFSWQAALVVPGTACAGLMVVWLIWALTYPRDPNDLNPEGSYYAGYAYAPSVVGRYRGPLLPSDDYVEVHEQIERGGFQSLLPDRKK